MLRMFVFACLTLVLAACGEPRVVPGHVARSYTFSDFIQAAAGRDLRTVVIGTPFGGDPASFGQTVTDAMQGHHFGPRTNFTTNPGPSALADYRVMMVFNAASAVPDMNLCAYSDLPAQPAQPQPGKPHSIILQAAFCRNDRTTTAVSAYANGVIGPTDPGFLKLVASTTLALFPTQNPDHERNDFRFFSACRFTHSC